MQPASPVVAQLRHSFGTRRGKGPIRLGQQLTLIRVRKPDTPGWEL